MYIQRNITNTFNRLVSQYPVLTLLGPRQSGKTTLVKHELPHLTYINLEDPKQRELINADRDAFFRQYSKGVILDEIQQMPELLSTIQVIVDANPEQKGLFILTGSHQLALHQAISQSLAGRTALLMLLPLSLSELPDQNKTNDIDRLLLQGFYPRIYHDDLNPTEAYRFYYQTYVERDVRQLIQLKDLNAFHKFIKLCAGRIGQVINHSSLSNDVGVSATTVRHWLSILEASYIITQLNPYYENFGKRLIKSPKLYFTDVGLAAFLLDIENTSQLARDPLRGLLFENLVVLDVIKNFYNQAKLPPLYFYRDQHGNEVDLLIKQGNEFIAVEIKASSTFTQSFLKGIKHFESIVGDRLQRGLVVYSGHDQGVFGKSQLVNFLQLENELK